MKKLILIGLMASCLTGCAVKSPSDNEIRRGMGTHNFLVISEQIERYPTLKTWDILHYLQAES